MSRPILEQAGFRTLVARNGLQGLECALAWLANHLAAQGKSLAAGQVVTTGVVTEFVELQAGDHAVADFGDFGEVRVGFI